MCLLHKTKSFDLKKYQIYFWELEKIGLWFVRKNHICFVDNKELVFGGKYRSIL